MTPVHWESTDMESSQKQTESHTHEEKQLSTKDFETKNPEICLHLKHESRSSDVFTAKGIFIDNETLFFL